MMCILPVALHDSDVGQSHDGRRLSIDSGTHPSGVTRARVHPPLAVSVSDSS